MPAKPKQTEPTELVPGHLTYVGPFDSVDVAGVGVAVRGVPFKCPATLAGHGPLEAIEAKDATETEPAAEAQDAHPGAGLLAQTDNFRLALAADLPTSSSSSESEA